MRQFRVESGRKPERSTYRPLTGSGSELPKWIDAYFHTDGVAALVRSF